MDAHLQVLIVAFVAAAGLRLCLALYVRGLLGVASWMKSARVVTAALLYLVFAAAFAAPLFVMTAVLRVGRAGALSWRDAAYVFFLYALCVAWALVALRGSLPKLRAAGFFKPRNAA